MTHTSNIPAPTVSERDADGRLVGLVFDSAPPLTTPEKNIWLVAVDGSDNALRAVAHAARQASEMKACALHLVNVQHWLSREAAESEFAQRGWHATERARALLDAAGLPWRLHLAMGDAGENILRHAAQLGCMEIFIGSRGLGTIEGLMLGSVAYKLVHTSPLPVLVAP